MPKEDTHRRSTHHPQRVVLGSVSIGQEIGIRWLPRRRPSEGGSARRHLATGPSRSCGAVEEVPGSTGRSTSAASIRARGMRWPPSTSPPARFAAEESGLAHRSSISMTRPTAPGRRLVAARAMSFSLSSPPSSGVTNMSGNDSEASGSRTSYLMITATPGHDDQVENPDGCCLDQLGKRGRDAPERDHLGHDNDEALDQRCVDAPRVHSWRRPHLCGACPRVIPPWSRTVGWASTTPGGVIPDACPVKVPLVIRGHDSRRSLSRSSRSRGRRVPLDGCRERGLDPVIATAQREDHPVRGGAGSPPVRHRRPTSRTRAASQHPSLVQRSLVAGDKWDGTRVKGTAWPR